MEEKRKRGRPRKLAVLPDEIQQIVDDVKAKEESEFQEIIQKEKEKRKGEWDIKKDDPIEFFDPELSYELSGYKPITDTKGLDFDPSWFTEARETKKLTGHYSQFPRNTKAYADFWNKQYKYCRDGMTVNGYTITGDHYFFLNFYQLMDLTSAKKAGEGRIYDFPSFYVEQYKWFHYLELCKSLRKNVVLMKARGVGFSEMDASLAANTYNCRQNSITVIAAQQDVYLQKTLDKTWKALTYLNDHTDGAFFKLRQVADSQNLKRASHKKKVNGQEIEEGWMSQIQGINADKPNKIRGDRTDVLIYEEAGSWPNLLKAFIQGDALVGIQGAKFGYKVAGGTGGDSGAALEGLRKLYENPIAYDALPYKHNYTQSGETVYTGFFIPAQNIVRDQNGEYMDNRGYTDPKKGLKFYEKERTKMANDPKGLLIYSAEFCFNQEEAFSLEGDNKFNKVIIAEQKTRSRILKVGPKIETGSIDYLYSNNRREKQDITGFKWTPDINGSIHILEHPVWTLPPRKNETTGEIEWTPPEKMRNLYVAGIDSIDIGQEQTSEYTKDPSKFCIVIKKRIYGMEEPQYVAYYKERPQNEREAYKIAIKLMQYYNCQANIEATRMSMITWARDQGYLGMFMKRPRATYPDPNKINRSTIGTPATQAVIAHQTDLIANFVEDYGHNIWFDEMIDELERYSDENKTKFDMIAAMGMAELADEELAGVIPRQIEVVEDEFQDFGYYVDEYGHRRFGIIPKRTEFKTAYDPTWNPRYNDYHMNKTSDPRRRL